MPKDKAYYERIYHFFALSIPSIGLPSPVREYHFNPNKKWKVCRRIDFFWPDYKLALEIEGGAWTKKGHTNGVNFIKDMEKYNELEIQGIGLLRVTPGQVESGYALQVVERWFQIRFPDRRKPIQDVK